MNIALTKHFEELIARLVASGRYNNSSEVVRAGLRILDAEERSVAAGSFPPGSLKHLYTRTENRAAYRPSTATIGRFRPTSIRSTSIKAFQVFATSAWTAVATLSETS